MSASVAGLITVDRSVSPECPEKWIQCFEHPEFCGRGPQQYSLDDLTYWLHPRQRQEELIEGGRVLAELKQKDKLKDCLGYDDAMAIIANGVAEFSRVLGNKELYCWRCVAQNASHEAFVLRIGRNLDVLVGEWVILTNKMDHTKVTGHF